METNQTVLKKSRNSSIELLKILSIFIIVLSHVVMDLHQTTSVFDSGFQLALDTSTSSVSQFLLSVTRYLGMTGAHIFFACTVWFSVDGRQDNKRKALGLLLNVFLVSVISLIAVRFDKRVSLTTLEIVQCILPTTFSLNWFITLYILFLLVQPYLYSFTSGLSKTALVRILLVMTFLYPFWNMLLCFFGKHRLLYNSDPVIWIYLYFLIYYLKHYQFSFTENKKANIILLLIGLGGNFLLLLGTNLIGLKVPALSEHLLSYNSQENPFLILTAVALLNLFKRISFQSKAINCISGLTLYIYLFHENYLFRTYYRPGIMVWIHDTFGYNHILGWILAVSIVLFAACCLLAALYRCSLEKLVNRLRDILYPKLAAFCRKVVAKFTSL